MKRFVVLMLSAVLTASGLTAAQSRRPMTAEDLWNIKRISSLTVSPDGRYGCFVVTEYTIKDNKGNADLWLIDFNTNHSRRLTTHPASDNSPTWHPNSRTLAFVSRREGDYPQLYKIDVDGGEASLVAEMPLGAAHPKFFPDGRRIAFSADILPDYENDFEGMRKALKEKKDSRMTARVTENRLYRYWDDWLTDGYVTHLYSFDMETKERIDLTRGLTRMLSVDGSVDYDISPDGQWIALAINSTGPPYAEINLDVFLWKGSDFAGAKNLTIDNDDDDFSPFFSKDGKFLYYARSRHKGFPDNAHLVRYEPGSGTRQVLTERKDLSFGGFEERAGKDIFMVAEEQARDGVFGLNLSSGKLERLVWGGSMRSLQVRGDRMFFIRDDLSNPAEIFEWNLKTKKLVQLTTFNKSLLDSLQMGAVKSITYKGADGRDVQMYLLYPPYFDQGKKYPLLHLIHGGPHGTFADEFHYRWNAQLFAAPGYVAAMVNFHGSTSFGNDFAKSIVGAHGDKPFRDIMLATDYLIRTCPFIDSTRMAAAGGSYGGYMVNWIAGHTNRFRCLISHAGVYNLMGQFASDVTHDRDKSYSGSPWEGKYEEVNRYSPAFFAQNFKTPMLIIHGERDYRVPVTQGLEIYGVLQGKGVPARLVYYPNENHWILTPQNSIYWYKEVHEWLKRYLQ
jgi:dipeptidyl aminopeptidase/acylaminoacyl peptidase